MQKSHKKRSDDPDFLQGVWPCMLTYVLDGDLLTSPAQTLVNTVNLVGVMGKGLALRFKQVYPEMFRAYQSACESRTIDVGRSWLYRTPRKWILNFPTKRHWRQPSRIEDIEQGLQFFVRTYAELGIYSVAFPALGCGNGELHWDVVRPLMERYLKPLPITVFIYPPRLTKGAPEHRVPETIRNWLQSEPHLLPISEVWDDLVQVAQVNSEIQVTQASDESDPTDLALSARALHFKSRETEGVLYEEDLAAFWDVFRSRGMMEWTPVSRWFGSNAPFVWALFRRLTYIQEVQTHPIDQPKEKTLQLMMPSQSSHEPDMVYAFNDPTS